MLKILFGNFPYKLRPSSETSFAFGNVSGGNKEVSITDKVLTVYRLEKNGRKTEEIKLDRNQFTGLLIGVRVNGDGPAEIGVRAPGELLLWLQLFEGGSGANLVPKHHDPQ
ncbi:MAG: hypothetical protein Q8L74_10305 [Nitrospirota bacterium]|nr:hypothetical protein [Nitrospirota bacterium]MDP2383269.1 hypothetical protein [Nitrospirota bacterium]MDP3598925.1 hypothetical protein [Nitrospirota bacterium]